MKSKKSIRFIKIAVALLTFVTCGAIIYITYVTEADANSSPKAVKNHLSSSELLTEEQCIPVCDTKECIFLSKFQQKFMNENVDPCDNFAQYVCGGCYERSSPDESQDIWRRNSKIMSRKLKNLIESFDANSKNASGKAKIVYDSCMKYSSSEVNSLPIILQFLNNLGIPDWPNLNPDFKFEEPNIIEVVSNFLRYEEYAFIGLKTQFSDNYDENVAFFYRRDCQEMNEMCYESYEKSSRKYLVHRILSYFSLDTEKIVKIWDESEEILETIRNLRQPESERVVENDEGWDCTTMMDGNKKKDTCQVMESVMESVMNSKNAEEFAKKSVVSISSTDFYFVENIFPVLNNFTDESVANYLAINLILNNMKELNLYFQLTREKIDSLKQPILLLDAKHWQWEKCVDWVSSHMTLAVGYEYIKNVITVPAVKEVIDMTEECMREALDLISHQEWISGDAKPDFVEEAEYMLENHQSLQWYLDLLMNETTVNGFYETFHPIKGNFLQNIIEYKKYFKSSELLGLHSNDERMIHSRDIFAPNGAGGSESITIDLGLLLPPLFTPGVQRLLNLASIGDVISHEIGHGVRQKLRYVPVEEEYYEEREQCLITQYSNFTVEVIGKKVNGIKTLTENFPDDIAISVIDKLVKKYSTEENAFYLPSFSLSTDQQMYISRSQAFCSVLTKYETEFRNRMDVHSPPEYRIIGPLQNSIGFSEAFRCPDISYMNPVPKCNILHA